MERAAMTRCLFRNSTWGLLALLTCAVSNVRGDFKSPGAGEVWSIDSLHVIAWNPADWPQDSTLRLEVSTDGGRAWTTAAEKVPNTGRAVWKVAGAPSKEG